MNRVDLEPLDRQLLALRYLREPPATYKQIAQRLGMTPWAIVRREATATRTIVEDGVGDSYRQQRYPNTVKRYLQRHEPALAQWAQVQELIDAPLGGRIWGYR